MTPEEILIKRKLWYDFKPVQFEIVKNLQYRELAFLLKGDRTKNSRYITAYNIDYLAKNFKIFQFFKHNFYMYHSVATIKGMPIFSWCLRKRTKEDDYKTFGKEFDKYVTGYNAFFDFDIKENFDKGMKEVFEFKNILEESKVPYYILNSSEAGIHFHIPNEFMPEIPIPQLIDEIRNVIFNIKGIYEYETLDSSITDLKRLCKVPYSCVNDTVCLPLTDEQLNQYKDDRSFLKIDNVLKKIKIKERGLILRRYNLDDSQLKLNTKDFLKEFQ